MTNLLINEPAILLLPTLATKIGVNEAIFLQQLHYWTRNKKIGKEVDGKKWIWNSVKEWRDENFPFWHVNVISRIIKTLVNDGLIATRSDLNDRKGDQTLWYSINYDALSKIEKMDGPIDRIAKKRTKKKRAGEMATKRPIHQNGELDQFTKMVKPLPETTETNSKELVGNSPEAGLLATSSNQEKTNSQERNRSDLDRIKVELMDYFVELIGPEIATFLPKEGAGRNSTCYTQLQKLYLYYQKQFVSEEVRSRSKTKYIYDERAINASKDILKRSVNYMIENDLTFSTVKSVEKIMGRVMRGKAFSKQAGKASLLT